MVHTGTSKASEARSSGYRVEAPRASDAIGSALRDAYSRDQGLPDDMADLLRRLNGATSLHAEA